MIEIISGVFVAVGLILVTVILKKYFTTKLIAAGILIAIAFIYVGFALKENPTSLIMLEISMAVMLFFLAVIGYIQKTALLGYGIIFHGIWDILHHNGWFVHTDVPAYWPVFCMTIDLVYGVYLLYIFKKLPAWI
jgi:uncharacterized membrane protein HdeD (DUF308 family)